MGFGGTWLPVLGTPVVIAVSVARLIRRAAWQRVLVEALLAVYTLFAVDLALLPLVLEPTTREWYREANAMYWTRSVNLVPFRTILSQLAPHAPDTALRQIMGNVALLIPFGVLAPAAWPGLRRLRSILIAALLVACGVEALQLLERLSFVGWRSIDIDDVLLNAIGGLLGFAVWSLAARIRTRGRTTSADSPAA